MAPLTLWPERVWPVAKEATAPALTLLLALVAGLVGALTLRLDVPGIGCLLTGAAMVAAALAGRRTPAVQVAAAVLAVALLAVGTIRAADWLFALCVLAAVVLATLSFAGGRTWIGLLVGSAAMVFVATRAVRWTVRGVRALGAGRGIRVGRIVLVVAVSIGLVLLFGGLFYGADDAFASIVNAVLPQFLGTALIGNTILAVLVAAVTLGGACLAALPPRFDALARERTPLRTWEWAVPLAVLNVLFGVFTAIQLVILFGHRKQGLAGNYSEYARQGFWQLLAVTMLTLLVVAVAAAKAGRVTARDRLAVRVLLGALCVFTLVIVASAMARMQRYEEAFGFTQLRVFVHAVEIWLGVVFLLVLAAGVRLRGAWLFRAILASGALGLLALAALNPDAYIAERNVERFEATGKIDAWYLSQLGPDAVPALQRLPDPQRSCALRFVAGQLAGTADSERWYVFNAGRDAARRSLAETPPNPAVTCDADR